MRVGAPLEVLPTVPVWGSESEADATWFALRMELASRGADLGTDLDVARLADLIEEWVLTSVGASDQRVGGSRAGSEMPCPARIGPVPKGVRTTRTP